MMKITLTTNYGAGGGWRRECRMAVYDLGKLGISSMST